MSRKFLTHLDLSKNELQNGVIQNLAAAPSSPVKGLIYFNSTDNVLYWYNGTAWVAASPGTGFPGYGSVTAETTFGGTSTDGVATTVSRSDHRHANPLHDNAAHAAVSHSALAPPTADVSWGGFKITNLANPVATTDAVNFQTLQDYQAGLAWKDSARAGTTANITLSAPQTIDGVSVIAGNRVLVKNQTNGAENGIYQVNAGAWTRWANADSDTDLVNASVFLEEGTTQADTAWVMTTNLPITVGTTPLTWVQFAGTGMVVGGAGLTLTGNTLNVGAGTGVTVAADTVALDTTYTDGRYALAAAGAKRYAVDVGGATSQVVTHNLNTLDCIAQLYRKASPFDQVEADVEHTSVNSVTYRFTVAPSAAEYRAVVLA